MTANSSHFICSRASTDQYGGTIPQQIAQAVCEFHLSSTGHSPEAVSVVMTDDTLVITLHEALTLAERALSRSADGATQVQEFHRRLFATASGSLQKEIRRITGRQVKESTAEVEPTTGAIVHAFTTGTMVQVFLLTPENESVVVS